MTVSSGAAHERCGDDIERRRATTNGGIVVDAKTGAGTAGAITRQGAERRPACGE